MYYKERRKLIMEKMLIYKLWEYVCNGDIEKLKKGNCLAQVFAIFVDQKLNCSSFDEFMKIYNNFITMEKQENI